MRKLYKAALALLASLLVILGIASYVVSTTSCPDGILPSDIARSVKAISIDDTWELAPEDDRAAVPVMGREPTRKDQYYYLYLVDFRECGALPVVVRGADYPAWSSDGKLVAFSRDTHKLLWNTVITHRIEVYSWQEKTISCFGDGFADRSAAWQPGVRKLAFARKTFSLTDNSSSGWVMVGSMSGEPRRTGPTYVAVQKLKWRPGGNQIALIGVTALAGARPGQPRVTDLYMLDAAGNHAKIITVSGDVQPCSLDWSPDGRLLVFTTGWGSFRTLKVWNATTGATSVILRAEDVDNVGRIGSARWSPKGNAIIFDVWKYESAGPTNVAMLEWPQLRSVMLTHDGKSRAPRWSSDGERVFYIQNDTSIWVMNRDGTRAKRVYVLPNPN